MRDGDCFFLRAVFLSCLCIAATVAQNPTLRVEYENSNYGEPILSCVDPPVIEDATFSKDNEEISASMLQQTNTAGRYRYVFAPGSGEANFSCSDGSRTSDSILLIGTVTQYTVYSQQSL